MMRVLKPGGYLVVFGGTRTEHRMVCAVEDAGFEIRDKLMWLFGQGFPKSLNVGEGWGTALKPAYEPFLLARKPLSEKNLADNILKWDTGAINVDGCRIPTEGEKLSCSKADPYHAKDGSQRTWNPTSTRGMEREQHPGGRWPANVVLDEEAAAILDEQTGASVSRFFYCPKASQSEREAGLTHLPPATGAQAVRRKEGTAGLQSPRAGAGRSRKEVRNIHPTVKPIALMRWLVRLVTPPEGLVVDPFCGSGSTLIAAALEGFLSIGIDSEEGYCELAHNRLKHWEVQRDED